MCNFTHTQITSLFLTLEKNSSLLNSNDLSMKNTGEIQYWRDCTVGQCFVDIVHYHTLLLPPFK